MRKSSFWIAYGLLLIVQILISNFLDFTPYLSLSILPVMVLCIPSRITVVPGMLIAFASGLAVDYFSEGVLGLNALSLVPVALARIWLFRLVFGAEIVARSEDFTPKRNGWGRISFVVVISQLLFLGIYIWADGAGLRPHWFNAARLAISLLAGWVFSIPVLGLLASNERR